MAAIQRMHRCTIGGCGKVCAVCWGANVQYSLYVRVAIVAELVRVVVITLCASQVIERFDICWKKLSLFEDSLQLNIGSWINRQIPFSQRSSMILPGCEACGKL